MSEKPGNNDITKVAPQPIREDEDTKISKPSSSRRLFDLDSEPETISKGKVPPEIIRRYKKPEDQPTRELDPKRIKEIDDRARLEDQERLRQEVLNLQAHTRNQTETVTTEEKTKRTFFVETKPPEITDSEVTKRIISSYNQSETGKIITTSVETPIPQPLPTSNNSGEIWTTDNEEDSLDIPITVESIDHTDQEKSPASFFPPVEIEEPQIQGSTLINLGGISTAGIYGTLPHLYDQEMTAYGELLHGLPAEVQQIIRYTAGSRITEQVLQTRTELAESVDIIRALARMSKETSSGLLVPESEAYRGYYLPALRDDFEEYNLVITRLRITITRILGEFNELKPILEKLYSQDLNRELTLTILKSLIESLGNYIQIFNAEDYPLPTSNTPPNPESRNPREYVSQLTDFFHLNVVINLSFAQRIMATTYRNATRYEAQLKEHPNMIPQERHVNKIVTAQVGNLEAIAEDLRTILYHVLRIVDSMYPEEFKQAIREDQRVLQYISTEHSSRLDSEKERLTDLTESTKSNSGSVIRRIFGGNEKETFAELAQRKISIAEGEKNEIIQKTDAARLRRFRSSIANLMLELPIIERLLKG